MTDFTRSFEIVIDASVHEVFEYCRDPHHLFVGWPELEVTDVVMTPEGVGTKAHIVGRFAKGMWSSRSSASTPSSFPTSGSSARLMGRCALRDGPRKSPTARSSRGCRQGRGHEVDLRRSRGGPRLVAEPPRVCQCGDHGEEHAQHAGGHQDRRGEPGLVNRLTPGPSQVSTVPVRSEGTRPSNAHDTTWSCPRRRRGGVRRVSTAPEGNGPTHVGRSANIRNSA